jgi:hypothetical protein
VWRALISKKKKKDNALWHEHKQLPTDALKLKIRKRITVPRSDHAAEKRWRDSPTGCEADKIRPTNALVKSVEIKNERTICDD